MNPIPQVTQCVVVGPTSVRLKFRDGWTGMLDLATALRGPIFGPLSQPEKFRQVAVHDGTLVWPNGADICPDVLRYWCELGRVCSQEELDAHFMALYSSPSRKIAETRGKYTAKRKTR